MLTILHDPAGIVGVDSHPWDYAKSIQGNIELHLDGGAECSVLINGLEVDPLIDPRMDKPPTTFDLVTVVRRPAGIEILGLTLLEWAAVAALAMAVYAYMNASGMEGMNASGKDSPNNKLTAQTNVARAYQAIPDVYGYRRVWPDLIQPSTIEYVDNVKLVTEWLCVCRGKGTITDVQYAETPIGDIEGSSFETFEPVPVDGYPEFGTTSINDVYETFACADVNGQEIAAEEFVPVARNGSYLSVGGGSDFSMEFPDGPEWDLLKTTVLTDMSRVEFDRVIVIGADPVHENALCVLNSYSVLGSNVTFNFTAFEALTFDVGETGSDLIQITPQVYVSTTLGPFTLPVSSSQIWWSSAFLRGLRGSVDIHAEWWAVDSGGVEIPGTREDADYNFFDASYDQRFYTTKITPAAGTQVYRIQFTRTNASLEVGADVAKLESVYAVRYHATKELPGVTVLRVTTKATLAATGFSERKFNLRWARHVRTLTSDALSPSRNFARSMAHIWTLAGNDISELDTDALADINSDLGEDSALLRFDGSFDDADVSLGERMQIVAGTARCMVWRDGLQWTTTRDQSRPSPEMQFDYRNLAAGGESAIGYSSHLPASFDGVEIEYVDEVTQSRKSYIRLDINSGAPVVGMSRNPKKFKLTGCATESQANNRAQLEARRLIYQRTNIADTALADAMVLGRGACVRWIDPNDFGGDDGLQAGEVLSIDAPGLSITTSEPLDWKGESSGRIRFTGSDGRYLGAPVICYPGDGVVLLASIPAGLFVAGGDRQLGSRYAFAVGLTEDELEAAALFTVGEVSPASSGTASIALVTYDERMYEFD